MTTLNKLIDLLTLAERRSARVLLALMLAGMVLETLGVGIVIPVLALMTKPDVAVQNPALAPWLARLGSPSPTQLIGGAMLMLVGVYTLKVAFLAFLAWKQAQFVFGLQASLSQRLFTTYLRQPYTFHLQRNSAQLISNVVGEVAQFTAAILAATGLATEASVVVGIAALLLVVEPLGALVVMLALGLAGFGFHRATRARILMWGAARLRHDGQRIQHLQQGLGGAKDVKLLGREDDFLSQYALHNTASARMSMRQNTLLALPRLWLELLAVIGLAALVFSMLAQGKPVATLIPTLGLFVAAAFRLMPSVNRVLSSVQSMRYSLPVIDILHAESKVGSDTESRRVTAEAKNLGQFRITFSDHLDLAHVSYTYPDAPTAALCDINICIPRGGSVGFVGGTGAGKSTLIDVILGLLTPTHGEVRVDGVDIEANLRGWQDQIGYVPQTIYLTDDSLRRNVAFGLADAQIDEAAVRRAITAAQLDEFVASLPEGLATFVGERGIRLSGGQRQRIGIARALYHNPPVLVLDEATSALDTDTEQGVIQAVRQLQGNKTVLIVAHRLSTVAHCDRLYRLDRGRIVNQGSYSDVVNMGDRAPIEERT